MLNNILIRLNIGINFKSIISIFVFAFLLSEQNINAFEKINRDTYLEVLSYLEPADLCRVCQVNKEANSFQNKHRNFIYKNWQISFASGEWDIWQSYVFKGKRKREHNLCSFLSGIFFKKKYKSSLITTFSNLENILLKSKAQDLAILWQEETFELIRSKGQANYLSVVVGFINREIELFVYRKENKLGLLSSKSNELVKHRQALFLTLNTFYFQILKIQLRAAKVATKSSLWHVNLYSEYFDRWNAVDKSAYESFLRSYSELLEDNIDARWKEYWVEIWSSSEELIRNEIQTSVKNELIRLSLEEPDEIEKYAYRVSEKMTLILFFRLIKEENFLDKSYQYHMDHLPSVASDFLTSKAQWFEYKNKYFSKIESNTRKLSLFQLWIKTFDTAWD